MSPFWRKVVSSKVGLSQMKILNCLWPALRTCDIWDSCRFPKLHFIFIQIMCIIESTSQAELHFMTFFLIFHLLLSVPFCNFIVPDVTSCNCILFYNLFIKTKFSQVLFHMDIWDGPYKCILSQTIHLMKISLGTTSQILTSAF